MNGATGRVNSWQNLSPLRPYPIGNGYKGSSVKANPYPVGKGVCNAEPALPKAVMLGLQQKQVIITQVIDGKLPLREAADRFQLAHLAAGRCSESTTGVPNHLIDNESVGRTVIGWVYLALSARPEQADRVSERLEVEIRDTLKNATTVATQR
ncbi:MAG: hypothetical protein EXS09_07985 [Gemmataceae bacterium]|nr:hypothetical protein [Gemmataceae bacterium]